MGVSLEYQNKINEILKKFNYYVEKINNSINKETRNYYLEEVYEEIKQAFGRFNPKSDLEMFYYFRNIDYKIISLDKEENNLLVSPKKVLSLNEVK